jgi:proline dehydrogenase
MLSSKVLRNKKAQNLFKRCISTFSHQPKVSIFKDVSLIDLVKKAVVYKASQNDLVLKHGDAMTKVSYKVFGKKLTNLVIENTGGQIFTSGPTIQTLKADSERLYTDHGIWSGGNYVLEGIEEDNVAIFDNAKDYLIESLDQFAKGRPHCHLAIKLTGLGHMQMFKTYHEAQHMLLKGMFGNYSTKSEKDEWNVLSKDGVEQFLQDQNIEYTQPELDEFMKLAKFGDSEYPADQIGEVEFYENIHAHYILSDSHNTAIIKKICLKNGLDEETRQCIQRMQDRAIEITEKACKQSTLLFIDAEQTFIQDALDGFTRQLQTKFHKENQAFILNGYQ